jgi:hypothetical protein
MRSLFPALCAALPLWLTQSASADTREVRSSGQCDLARHERRDRPLEVRLGDRLSCRVSISCGPFPVDKWALFAPVFASNDTDAKLYGQAYIAFFDDDGRLVACLQQSGEFESGARDVQMYSRIAFAPRDRLRSATRYQIVVYESDRRPGEEPVLPEVAGTLPGRAGRVITRLEATHASTLRRDAFTELQQEAAVSFHDVTGNARNSHLRFSAALDYDLYLDTGLQESLEVRDAGGRNIRTILRQWTADAEIESPPARDRTLEVDRHLALLDREGRVIACASDRPFWLIAPEDRLLSATKLCVTVYESGGVEARRRIE